MAEPMFVGNWKMHKTPSQAQEYLSTFQSLIASTPARVILAVPFIDIAICKQMISCGNVIIAAQNVSDQSQGAYTGEISADMLKEAGADYVLVGHSERRAYYHETDAIVKEKTMQALSKGLIPIVCFGESLEDRNRHRENEVVSAQLKRCLAEIDHNLVCNIVLAYEPLWAIGTGLAATKEQVQNMHSLCRSTLKNLFGDDIAKKLPILYGGSVNEKNIVELIDLDDVDGVLVGGASLDPSNFGKMIQMCVNKR